MIRLTPPQAIVWPEKRDVFGVQMSVTTYDETVDLILEAARLRVPATVSFHSVYSVITTSNDPQMRSKVNTFEIVAPDGQPVRWALNLLHGTRLPDRVCGPDTMFRLCRRSAEEGVSVYLYGGAPDVLEELQAKLKAQFPGLRLAGAYSPPFRPLTPDEDDAAVRAINLSGAGMVFLGLGYPKQDLFAYDHRGRILAVQLCVGAAFDFHAGRTPRAPCWMQQLGLEWCHRLVQEPRRLWRRYLLGNTRFLLKFALALLRWRVLRTPVGKHS
jgi:N-acetylglucosaminyldiphosphoundecaprenol N-acetyl-beta-D-mannosaminyltransferase